VELRDKDFEVLVLIVFKQVLLIRAKLNSNLQKLMKKSKKYYVNGK